MAVGLLAFDVNETLLSLAPMRGQFDESFGGDPSLGEWFARILHGSILANLLDQYRPFDQIGVETLMALTRRRGRNITDEEARSIVGLMTEAPPHPDVVPGLQRLSKGGARMIALTNGSTEVANAQIDNAGLRPFLESVISCDEIGRFKPDPAVYRHAAEAAGVDIEEMSLVASHDWDCAGAMAAGAGAVFLARAGIGWNLPSAPPEVVVGDLGELAHRLVGG